MTSSEETKYERIAPRYSSRYADPEAIARRQLELIQSWGIPIKPGDSILELGCADGFSTLHLARAGFRVTAVDSSPGMIHVARQRLDRAGLSARFLVSRIEELELDDRYAVTASFRTLFEYVPQPQDVLRRLARSTLKKLVVDVNPRAYPLSRARDEVWLAGFPSVDWKPFLVPQRVRLPRAGLVTLQAVGELPGIRSLLLRRKFVAVIKGEKP